MYQIISAFHMKFWYKNSHKKKYFLKFMIDFLQTEHQTDFWEHQCQGKKICWKKIIIKNDKK